MTLDTTCHYFLRILLLNPETFQGVGKNGVIRLDVVVDIEKEERMLASGRACQGNCVNPLRRTCPDGIIIIITQIAHEIDALPLRKLVGQALGGLGG